MLKILIGILILVILLAIGLNKESFTAPPIYSPLPTAPTIIEKETTTIKEVVISKKQESNNSIQTDNNLSAEIQALFIKANDHFQNSQDEEAQNIYSLIIKKVKDNNETKFLKYFAEAYRQKAFIFKIYPSYDKDSSIEMLDVIIKKFENAKDIELIEFYINAKIEQAYLQTEEDSLETYDELIKKFKDQTEPYFTKKIEELLLAKSFALMGKNDEEAMEILDGIIDKYQKSGEKTLPEKIRFSILNNIELAIITNNDDSRYRELADTYMNDSPDKAPLLDMLAIIRNAQDLNQDDALQEWKKNYNDYRFPDWSFDELRKWAYRIEDRETKNRLLQYIDTFENHKYQISSNNTVYDPKETTYAEQPTEEVIEEPKPVEYTDPYINDLPVVNPDPYANDTPIIYETPYSNSEESIIYDSPISYETNLEDHTDVIYEPIEH